MALYLVIQVSALLSRIVPRSWRYLIGTAVGDIVYLVWTRKRQILRGNMAIVLGQRNHTREAGRLAVKSMRNYCKYLVEFLELPALSSQHPVVASIRIDGLEHLQAALAGGKGVIITTGHYGTLELPGLRLTDFTDFHAVYDTFRPKYLDRLIQRKRLEKGIELIPATNVRKMFRVLKDGGTVALLFDRPVELAKGVRVRFFGRETAVPGGPAVLAMKTGAPILPVYTTREPDLTFHSMVGSPIVWIDSGDRDRDIQTVMQKLMNTLESAVLRRPDQWYMFRPMWPEITAGRRQEARESVAGGPVA